MLNTSCGGASSTLATKLRPPPSRNTRCPRVCSARSIASIVAGESYSSNASSGWPDRADAAKSAFRS
jgi:hypothetical protein